MKQDFQIGTLVGLLERRHGAATRRARAAQEHGMAACICALDVGKGGELMADSKVFLETKQISSCSATER